MVPVSVRSWSVLAGVATLVIVAVSPAAAATVILDGSANHLVDSVVHLLDTKLTVALTWIAGLLMIVTAVLLGVMSRAVSAARREAAPAR